MIRSLISYTFPFGFIFTFILTHAVLAQAADNGTIHINAQKWIPTYSAETEFEGLPVTARLEESSLNLEVPQAMAGVETDAMVPSPMTVVKKAYRLNLIVSRSPLVQINYAVEPRIISIDGSPRYAFVSDLDGTAKVHFLITTEKNGSLHVSYADPAAEDTGNSGEFALAPVPHIFNK